MSVSSVYDIQVNSKEFEKFKAMFDRHQATLAKMPDFWKNISKEQKGSAANFQKMTEQFSSMQRQSRKLNESTDLWRKNLHQVDRYWTSMASSTKSVAANILTATRSLLSWSSLITGVGGALITGSLFGIDRLAGSVASQRRSAQGLGLSIGSHKAFGTDFGRFVDTDSFLGWMSQMEADPREARAMFSLGVRRTGDTEKDSLSLLRAIRARAKATPESLLGLLPQQLGLNMSLEELRRLRSSSEDEFSQQFKRYGTDRNRMGVSDDAARKFQDLVNVFQGNFGALSSSFVNKAAQLAPSLANLSNSFTKLVTTMINSKAFDHGLSTLTDWINKFSGIVGAPDFQKKVDDFAERFGKGVGQFVDGAERVAAAVERIAGAVSPFMTMFDAPKDNTARGRKNRFMEHLATLEENFGLPKGMLQYQKERESGGALNPPDNKGHVGAFQFDPKTADWLNKMYGKHLDPRNPDQAALLAGYYDKWLLDHYSGNVANALGAWNWGDKNMDAYNKTGRGVRGQPMPAETQSYISGAAAAGLRVGPLQINVNVHAPPGSSVDVAASQLAIPH